MQKHTEIKLQIDNIQCCNVTAHPPLQTFLVGFRLHKNTEAALAAKWHQLLVNAELSGWVVAAMAVDDELVRQFANGFVLVQSSASLAGGVVVESDEASYLQEASTGHDGRIYSTTGSTS